MTAFERLLAALDARGCKVTGRGRQRMAQCPAHEDRTPSLSITEGETRVLVHCHGSCETVDVLAALGLAMSDLYNEPRGSYLASYQYRDPGGTVLRTVHRTAGKSFPQSGQTKGTSTLYRLPDVIAAVAAGRVVHLVEGEEDVHALEVLGVVATTAPMGASNFANVDATPLTGAHVVAIPDRDAAGDQWLADVRSHLDGVTDRLEVRAPAVGKDASDHVAAGKHLDDLVDVPDPDAQLEARLAFNRAVSEETHRLRVREAAGRIVRQERAGALVEPSLVRLDDFLAVPDEPESYRVAGPWPVGGRVVLAAQFKAGKTTLRDNLVRALVDGGPFLGHFTVHPPEGRVVVIDDELDKRMLRRWMREQDVTAKDRVEVLALRGKVATFDLLDEDCRARWAQKIRAAAGSVVILDCLRPVLDALGLSEDKDAGRFLVAFDALLEESGASEGVVTHHMGHNGERSRGDSRILDWPDATWKLLREKSEDGEVNPDARRYFSAFGRDVDQAEGLLDYDHEQRRLTLTGGTRKETASDEVMPALVAYLEDNPGASGRQIEIALKDEHRRDMVRTAIRRTIAAGGIATVPGPKRATLHYLSAPSAPEVRERTESECASALIESALTLTPPNGSSAPPRTQEDVALELLRQKLGAVEVTS